MDPLRPLRIIIGIFLPPLIGCTLFLVLFFGTQENSMSEIGIIPALYIIAYIVMLLPSIGYSVVMELIARDWFRFRFLYYGIAGALGAVASLTLSPIKDTHIPFTPFVFIGVLTGISTASILRMIHFRVEAAENECEPGGSINSVRSAHSVDTP